MPWRQSFYVPPALHQNPIPTACRVGNVLFTSVIGGRDPETGAAAASLEENAKNCFRTLAKVLAAAGAGPADVARVTVFLSDAAARPFLNAAWSEMFPDAASRPARHTILQEDAGGAAILIEAIAVIPDR